MIDMLYYLSQIIIDNDDYHKALRNVLFLMKTSALQLHKSSERKHRLCSSTKPAKTLDIIKHIAVSYMILK